MPQVLKSVSGRQIAIDAGFVAARFPDSRLDRNKDAIESAPLQRVESGIFDWYARAQARPAKSPLPPPPTSRGPELAVFADTWLGPQGARQVAQAIDQTWTADTAIDFVFKPAGALSTSGCDLKQSATHWLLSHFSEVAHAAALQEATGTIEGLEKLNRALLTGVRYANRKLFRVENAGGSHNRVTARLHALRDAMAYRSYEAALLHLLATCEPQQLSESKVIEMALRLGYSGCCLDAVEAAYKALRRLHQEALTGPGMRWAKENGFADVIASRDVEADTSREGAERNRNWVSEVDAECWWYTRSPDSMLLTAAYKANHFGVLREIFRTLCEDDKQDLAVDSDGDSDSDDDVRTVIKWATIAQTGSDTLDSDDEEEGSYDFLALCMTGNVAAVRDYLTTACPDARAKALSNAQAAAVLTRLGHDDLLTWLLEETEDASQLFTAAMIAIRDGQYGDARILLEDTSESVRDKVLENSKILKDGRLHRTPALAFALEMGSDAMRERILTALREKHAPQGSSLSSPATSDSEECGQVVGCTQTTSSPKEGSTPQSPRSEQGQL